MVECCLQWDCSGVGVSFYQIQPNTTSCILHGTAAHSPATINIQWTVISEPRPVRICEMFEMKNCKSEDNIFPPYSRYMHIIICTYVLGVYIANFSMHVAIVLGTRHREAYIVLSNV